MKRRLSHVGLLGFGIALAIASSQSATGEAAPYFRPGLDRVNVGLFQGLDQDRTDKGFTVPVLVHDAASGYWLIPGISWDLLDLGYSEGGGYPRTLRIGPSVNLDEPVKAGLRFGCRALPGWGDGGRYGLLKSALAPAGDGAATLALGPSFRLDVPSFRTREWKGGWDFSFTLNVPYGGKRD